MAGEKTLAERNWSALVVAVFIINPTTVSSAWMDMELGETMLWLSGFG